MSVYHEDLKSGRIKPWDCNPMPGQNSGLARALREVKRTEAEERNARTPYERTRQYRRDVQKGRAA